MKSNRFYIRLRFSENWFDKGAILDTPNGVRLKVLETPHKKWWKQLFQVITLDLYKAPTEYKCKII